MSQVLRPEIKRYNIYFLKVTICTGFNYSISLVW